MQCKHCGNTDCRTFYTEVRGNNTALICGNCGKWQKWVGKKDLRAIYGMGVKKTPIEPNFYGLLPPEAVPTVSANNTAEESLPWDDTMPNTAPKTKQGYTDTSNSFGGTQGNSGYTTRAYKTKNEPIPCCPACGGREFVRRTTSIHIGLYCGLCGKWIKWVKKS